MWQGALCKGKYEVLMKPVSVGIRVVYCKAKTYEWVREREGESRG